MELLFAHTVKQKRSKFITQKRPKKNLITYQLGANHLYFLLLIVEKILTPN